LDLLYVVKREVTVTYKTKYLAFVGLFVLSSLFSIALLLHIFVHRKPKETKETRENHAGEVLLMANEKNCKKEKPVPV